MSKKDDNLKEGSRNIRGKMTKKFREAAPIISVRLDEQPPDKQHVLLLNWMRYFYKGLY